MHMQDLSCQRAVISLLPIIGPFVADYNIWETEKEILSNPSINRINEAQDFLNKVENREANIAKAPQKVAGGTQRAERAAEKIKSAEQTLQGIRREEEISVREKGRVYAICGIIGSVLSVALLVGLTAFGILNSGISLICGACYTFDTFYLSSNLYQHHKIISCKS